MNTISTRGTLPVGLAFAEGGLRDLKKDCNSKNGEMRTLIEQNPCSPN